MKRTRAEASSAAVDDIEPSPATDLVEFEALEIDSGGSDIGSEDPASSDEELESLPDDSENEAEDAHLSSEVDSDEGAESIDLEEIKREGEEILKLQERCSLFSFHCALPHRAMDGRDRLGIGHDPGSDSSEDERRNRNTSHLSASRPVEDRVCLCSWRCSIEMVSARGSYRLRHKREKDHKIRKKRSVGSLVGEDGQGWVGDKFSRSLQRRRGSDLERGPKNAVEYQERQTARCTDGAIL